jgi:hypothetical protein
MPASRYMSTLDDALSFKLKISCLLTINVEIYCWYHLTAGGG